MNEILARLKSLERPVRTAIVGMGSAGRELFYQCGVTPGIVCVGIADKDVAAAVQAARAFDRPHLVVETPGRLEDAVAKGLVAICPDGRCSPGASRPMFWSTPAARPRRRGPPPWRRSRRVRISSSVNPEADLAFGPCLVRLAKDHGLAYAHPDGDLSGCLRRLIEEIRLQGFELILAGGITDCLDRYSDPTKIAFEACERSLDPNVCAGRVDGTVLSMEMAQVANACDLMTMIPGMFGPDAARLAEVFDLFDFEAIRDGGIPVVDCLVSPKLRGGVFVVGHREGGYRCSMPGGPSCQMAKGPFHLFERPLAPIGVEAIRCIAEAFLDRDEPRRSTYAFKTNVYAYAKRDLHRGETLDGIGGYACYGLIENCSDNRRHIGMPICLAGGMTLHRDIARDQKIFMEDVGLGSDRLDSTLYSLAAAELSSTLASRRGEGIGFIAVLALPSASDSSDIRRRGPGPPRPPATR